MIDNFKKVRELLKFRSPDDFYFVQVLQRKKDFKDNSEYKVSGCNNNSRLIKMYAVSSLEYFDKVESEIKELCKLFNARAGINLNRRSYEKIALQHLKKVTDQILNKDYEHGLKAYSSVCGTYSNENDKKWIIDVDSKDQEMKSIIDSINSSDPVGNKFIARLETRSGYHLIVSPFNVSQWNFKGKIDIHKDNPTNLFIP